MKKLTKLTALLLAGLLNIFIFASCNKGFDYTEEDEDDEKVTTTTTATTTTATTTTTTADKPDTPTPEVTDNDAPAENPDQPKPQPDVMPSEIYQQLITTEKVSMNADISERTWYCHLVKDGDLAEYYEYDYGAEVSFTTYYNLATRTVYYEENGKWYSIKDESIGSFADLMEFYGFGKNSIFFQDHNFDHYDPSLKQLKLKESLLDPQNGLLWGNMSYIALDSYHFQCQLVDQALESYGFTVNSEYPIMLPNDVIEQ